jgi:Protein of unknown function (DUF2946)
MTFGGRLALFALAVQLVLSFGHIHNEDFYGYGSPRAASAVASAAGHSQPDPSDRSSGHPDDYCPICATISLLSSSFVAEAPQLPVPIASRPLEHLQSVASVFVAKRRAPFQSRGPPLA